MARPVPEPQRDDGAASGATPEAAAGPALVIEDRAERRVRKPADLLRLAAGGTGLALLAGLGLVAQDTVAGLEIDIARLWRHLPGGMASVLGITAGLALLILPVVLALRQLILRSPRRVAEALVTAGIAAGLMLAAGFALRLPAAVGLYDALTTSRPGGSLTAPLDAYLAAFAAYVTVVDVTGQPRWRAAVWLTAGIYSITSLVAVRASALSLLISALAGWTIGVGVRYAAGLPSQRPGAAQIAAALSSAGLPVVRIRRVPGTRMPARSYEASLRGDGCLDVTVLDRDQEAAGALYRLYRIVRLRQQVARGLPLSMEHAAQRLALLCYATAEAGVPTPPLRALIRVGPDATVLAHERCAGTPLADLGAQLSQAQQRAVWRTVLRLHAHGVTHRALTADRILLDGEREVVLLDPGNGDVASTDLACRLDLAQLLTEFALLAGPDKAVSAAGAEVGLARLAPVLPLLQPVALYRSTRKTLRQHREILPSLRARLLSEAPGGEVPAGKLERVRLRTLVSLVAGVAAAYVLAGEVARADIASLIRHADWRWAALALVLSAATYLASALSLTGFVLEPLRFTRTCLAQLAASFVTLVAPAAVGSAALNIRYLQRNGVPAASATASVGVAQIVAFALHILLLVIFGVITGAGQLHSLQAPGWVYVVLAALVAALIAALAVPPARRLLRARLVPTLGQVIPRLLDIAHDPRKLAEGIGGTLLLTLSYVLCLAACVRALGGTVPITSVFVVYLTGSAIGSAAPTPGGLGAVEVALSAGLTAAGMAGATALSAVLLFRLLTFWLPAPFGWLVFTYLQRRGEV